MKSVPFLCVAGVLSLAGAAHAAPMYASTAAGGAGQLYLLESTTGAILQNVGPLNDVAGTNYGITGLAVHPVTGVLYGSVANNIPATRRRFVTINPLTAAVTVVGAFNVGNAGNPSTMADIGFDAAGNLFGLGSVGGPQLYAINLATAQATAVGTSGLTSTSGGGIAISPAGTVFATPTSTRFGTYDAATGVYTNIANPVRPVGGTYAALDFDPASGLLYGLNLGPDTAGLPTRLVTFDLATGATVDLAGSVPALDAIAFPAAIPEPGTLTLLAAPLALALCRRR